MTFSVKQIDKGGYYMKGFKKLTAGLMGVVMALGVCGFTAFAEDYVAEIGDTKYETLAKAIEAAKTDDKKGCTIVLLDDVTENGFKAEDGNKFTIDFNGFTYTIDGTVGSTGTETNGMQLLRGSDITLENGTIKSDKAKILIQKYGTLKIDDMELIGGDNCQYVISNNNGTTTITGDTNITARKGWYAFDVYYWPQNGKGYGAVDVIFDEDMTGTVEGKVQYASDGTDNENWLDMAKLTIESGNFDIEIDDQSEGDNASIEIVNGSFTSDVSDYLASNSAFVKDEDGNYVVADKNEIKDAKFYIADEDDLKEAIANQADGVTWVLKDSFEVSGMIFINTDVTIEGNDETLTFTGSIYGANGGQDSFIEVEDGADVVIKDLTLDGNSFVEGSENVKHGINVFSYEEDDRITSVTVDNVKIVNCGGNAITNNASKVVVESLETSGNLWGGINVDNSAKTTGTRIGEAILIINDAVISEEPSIYIENANNAKGTTVKAEINGGEFNGAVGSAGVNTEIEITGGKFNGVVGTVPGSDINITSGTFATDVEKYLAEGSHIVKIDGEYVVMDDERDSGRHSYSLKEGKTERDDEEEEPVVTPEPEEEEGPFSDVGKDNPNYDAIVEVYEKGWMVGIADGVFAPNGTLTRGMAVTILWNRAGQPEPASVAPFLDVTSDAWYAKAVAWAYENGITSGYGDTYGPDDFLTTEQFTRMNDIANGRTPEVYVGGAPYATRGWVAGMLVME